MHEHTHGVQEPDLSEQGRNRSAVLGNTMQALTEGGVPFVQALDATLKAFDHPPAGVLATTELPSKNDLLDLAAILDKAAEVRGTQHHQADWQRIAQRRAAGILRAIAGVEGNSNG